MNSGKALGLLLLLLAAPQQGVTPERKKELQLAALLRKVFP